VNRFESWRRREPAHQEDVSGDGMEVDWMARVIGVGRRVNGEKLVDGSG